MGVAAIATPETPLAILTPTAFCLPASPERSICRIDSMTPHSGHRPRSGRLIAARSNASGACGFSTSRSFGILAYEAGIERTTATIANPDNEQMKTPAIHRETRAGRSKCVRMSTPCDARSRERRAHRTHQAIHRARRRISSDREQTCRACPPHEALSVRWRTRLRGRRYRRAGRD
jgi:hypothetical protein